MSHFWVGNIHQRGMQPWLYAAGWQMNHRHRGPGGALKINGQVNAAMCPHVDRSPTEQLGKHMAEEEMRRFFSDLIEETPAYWAVACTSEKNCYSFKIAD